MGVNLLFEMVRSSRKSEKIKLLSVKMFKGLEN